jgi:hypothetical protein
MNQNQKEFTSLVKNALDFLEKSVRDLKAGEAKYSVIHFYSGLELFLKTRLLLEHWSLTASDVNKMAKNKFAAGDFQSIGLDEAKSRLANILDCKLSPSEEKVYDRLRKRRNQAVHFYHPDDLGSDKKVAVEQFLAWRFLYPRLTQTWKDSFGPFKDQFEELHVAISARDEYFPAVYDELKEEILKRAEKRLLAVCDLCGQNSALDKGEVVHGARRLECLVCDGETFAVFLPCRKCNEPALRSFEGETKCQRCGHPHKASLEETSKWAQSTYPTISPRAWCGDCGYTVKQSVIEIGTSSLCLACHAFYEPSDVAWCPWCGDTVTGGVSDGSSPACTRCAYSIEYAEVNVPAPVYMCDVADRRAGREMRRMYAGG